MSLPVNFSWVIPGRIAASGLPGYASPFEEELASLWSVGIRAILTLREDPLPVYQIDGDRRFAYHHEPMPDHSIPNGFDPIDRAVNYIRQMMNESKPVLVHCLAGIGRTGMVIASFVAVAEGLSGAEALRFLEMKRGPVDTFAQNEFVASYVFEKRRLT
ncbi:MAG: dual specificity protein phosphatase family protein [Planctomycetota bacterium]